MEKEIIIGCSRTFSNGVTVVNTTPHPINFLDGEEVVTVNSSKDLLINAKTEETPVGEHLVRATFSGSEEGQSIINQIKEVLPDAFIIGSILAANSYKEVVGMCPAPGFERVPPAEKRMSIDKFNVGECY